ncbi:CAP domain-containing protein [Desulforhopalus sp. 52FAK]
MSTIGQFRVSLIFLIIAIGPSTLQAGYGDEVNGFPTQLERDVHLITNLVRTAPQEFRDTYIGDYEILLPENYPAVQPIYLNSELNNSARSHAEDMAADCGLSHTSCDGTLWSARIKSYYSTSGYIAENVATGFSTGFKTVIQLLRDDIGKDPAADNSSGDGHRKNIMNSQYQDFGPGYAYSSSRAWYHFWVQDFGGGPHDYYAIASGSHLYLSDGYISFMATYYDPDGNAPQSAQVVINGVPYELNHHLGSSSNGSYQLQLADDNDCLDYYFQFVDSDNSSWRYPETTELSNNPDQACYVPASLVDAIHALQVVSDTSLNGTDIVNAVDYSGDGKIGLEDAIFILGK